MTLLPPTLHSSCLIFCPKIESPSAVHLPYPKGVDIEVTLDKGSNSQTKKTRSSSGYIQAAPAIYCGKSLMWPNIGYGFRRPKKKKKMAH